jgi:hypothetical protein
MFMDPIKFARYWKSEAEFFLRKQFCCSLVRFTQQKFKNWRFQICVYIFSRFYVCRCKKILKVFFCCWKMKNTKTRPKKESFPLFLKIHFQNGFFFYFLFCWFGVKNNCLCRPQKANQSLHYWPEPKWNPILRNYFFLP